MQRNDKYSALNYYLRKIDVEQITLTFNQVAAIVEGLPSSAYIYPAWWSNGGHTYCTSWMDAGFKSSLDITNQKVTFFKTGTENATQNIISIQQRTSTPTLKTRSTTTSLDIQMALEHIRKYLGTTSDGEHTRYRSWEHCYKAFQKSRHLHEKDDFLCLHLAYYLASWGMLRNSFLLNRDYLVHMPVVKVLTSGRFETLFTDEHTPETIPLVMQASKEIQDAYANNRASDTLITKILLGVFGCSPAYDRYFRDAARKYKVCSGEWGVASLKALWDFYQTYYESFEKLRHSTKFDGFTYTPMKLMDMCLWQIGFDEDSGAMETKMIEDSNKEDIGDTL